MKKVKLRPMLDAPKNYTTILLKIPSRDYLTRGRWASGGWAARTNMKYLDLSFNEAHQPTGWLPEDDAYLPLLRPKTAPSRDRTRLHNIKGLYAAIPAQWPGDLT